ncbi:slightly ste11-like protein [Recurvomyces mirabilis]|nr:slightly ste11-like protein [Recurvomyces mirabilis]
MSAVQNSLPSLPTPWEKHPAVQTPSTDDTRRIVFTRQLWQRTMPDGSSNEPDVLNQSQSQDTVTEHNNSATPTRRPSSNTSTRSQRRSSSPSRGSKTPLTPEESPPFKSTRKRTAGIVEIEDKELDSSTTTPVHSRGSSGDSTAHVCICQPDPKIPRPRNAFILYRQHHQAQVVSQNPGLSNPEISKIIGEQWQNQPTDIKNKWKALAEEEKLRHQQQYPQYRYQPKRNGRRGSVTSEANGEKPKCHKCGGRSLLAPSSALFPASNGASPASIPTTPRTVLTPVSRTLPPVFRELSIQSPAGRRMARTMHSSSNMLPHYNGHIDERDEVGPLSPDIKRRKYSDHPASGTRNMPPRYVPAGGPQVRPGTPFPFGQPTPQHPYPPAITQVHRGSLPGIRGVVSPPGPMPPPPRPGIGYQQHRMSQGHVGPDRSLVLPPLQNSSISGRSSTAALAGRSAEQQIMAMSFRYKVKVLSQVAPPAPHRQTPRGPLIVIEGDSVDAVEELGQWLYNELEKGDDLGVTLTNGPDIAANGSKKPMVQYHLLATEWLAKSDEIVDSLFYDPSPASSDHAMADAIPISEPPTSHRDLDENYDDNLTSPQTAVPATTTSKSSPEESMDVDKTPTNARHPTSTSTTSVVLPKTKPVVLVPNYSLTTSNTFALRIPIGPHDPYSPSDHWQWTATQWRGIVGPDLTIFVRDAVVGEQGKATVEILEESGLMSVRRTVVGGGEDGKQELEASVLRRLGFEVGEWVRTFGAEKGRNA